MEPDQYLWILLELLAVLSSLAFTWLAAHQKRSAWLLGIASAVLTGAICWHARLMAETSLQVYYLGISIFTYFSWKGESLQDSATATIRHMSSKLHSLIMLAGAALTWGMGYFWSLFGAALPYLDAFTTAFSILAVWLMAKRYLQSWIYWIVIDTVSIFMYLNRELYLMSLLFAAYTVLAIYGFLQWKKEINRA
jgi:nicotinamide mononucleotide transporter